MCPNFSRGSFQSLHLIGNFRFYRRNFKYKIIFTSDMTSGSPDKKNKRRKISCARYNYFLFIY